MTNTTTFRNDKGRSQTDTKNYVESKNPLKILISHIELLKRLKTNLIEDLFEQLFKVTLYVYWFQTKDFNMRKSTRTILISHWGVCVGEEFTTTDK